MRYRILAIFCLLVGVPGAALGAPALEETLTAAGNGATLLFANISGGTDQTYVLTLSEKNTFTPTVSGGGLTWTQRVAQCNGDNSRMDFLYTAQGSPGSAFQVQISWPSGAETAAVLSRYSGANSVVDATGENTNGEAGACSGGSNSNAAQLTLTSTFPDAIHVIGIQPKDKAISSVPSGYTLVGATASGATHHDVYQKSFAAATTDIFQATLGGSVPWATAGVVLEYVTPHFSIAHDGNADLCVAESITITRHDSAHAADAGYTGTVTLSTSTSNGSWSLVSGAGTLMSTGGGDATYDYAAGDSGEVVLGFTSGEPEVVSIGAADGSEAEVEDPDLTVGTPAVVVVEETVTGDGKDSITLPTIQGGTDQTYVLFISVESTTAITSVIGGGLTWTERKEQCSGKGERQFSLWTAQGSPGSFQVQFTTAASKETAAVLGRFSNVAAFTDPTGENTNGESGSCAGGTPSSLASLTLTSTAQGSMHLSAVSPKIDQTVSSVSTGYDLVDTHTGPKQVLWVYEQSFDAATDTFEATLSGNTDWVTAGLVLEPNSSPAQVCGADHFELSHDGQGVHCLGEALTVTAADSGGSPITDYTSQITLDTQSGKGTWSNGGGNSGSFSDATPNDGLATYTFADADDGVATFTLTYTEGTTPVNLHVYETGAPTIEDDDSEGTLAWSASGFTVTASAITNPPPNPIDDPVDDQTAGTSFTLHLAAYGTTATDSECGVIETYDGDKDLKFWSTYDDPSTGTLQVSIDTNPIATSEGSAAAQTVNFSSGQASVTAKYKDVGQLQIDMKDDTVTEPVAGITGATNLFVVKPADFFITSIQRPDTSANPAASTPGGDIFVAAGDPFRVTLEVRDSEGDRTPNYGNEDTPEGIEIESTTLVAPLPGRNGSGDDGAILNGTAFSATTPAGTFLGTTFAWDEVGAMQLTASVADDDYLGAGEVTGTETGDVGRFTPKDFAVALNTPQFDSGCDVGAFTYVGQEFGFTSGSEPVITVTARATAGTTTQNYKGLGTWWKIDNTTLTGRTYASASGTLDTTGLPATTSDPTIAANGDGTGTLTFGSGSGLFFTRTGTPSAPFDAEISLSLDVIDDDGIAYAGNPAKFADATAGGGMAFSDTKAVRYGRLVVGNAHDSELLDLPVPLRAEYWDGTFWANHGSDSCSAVSLGDLTLTKNPPALPTVANIDNDPLLSGDAGMHFDAPGVGNPGTVDIEVDLTASGADLTFLQWDWLSDGLPADGIPDDNPIGQATFGVYHGSDQVIFIRESY